MKYYGFIIWFGILSGSLSYTCPTCVGRADKNRPLFFSKHSYQKTPAHMANIAARHYNKLKQPLPPRKKDQT